MAQTQRKKAPAVKIYRSFTEWRNHYTPEIIKQERTERIAASPSELGERLAEHALSMVSGKRVG